MPDYTDFKPFYDFTLIEKAVQSLFVATDATFVAPKNDDDPNREAWTAGDGNTAFYTAFQALTFTKCRPRVWLVMNPVTPVPGARRVDANGYQRDTAWTAGLRFSLLTEAKYTTHIAKRTQVLALLPQIAPKLTVSGDQLLTTGLNAYLVYHQLATLTINPTTTQVTTEDGSYRSDIETIITFGIRPNLWPT